MLTTVESFVREASKLLVEEVNRPGGPRGGGLKAPVDEEIGAFLTEKLGEAFPDIGIVCEEGGSRDGKGQQVFYVDPNDGTRDFLNGYRENSISVGLVQDGEIVLSVVYAPFSTPLTGPEGMMVTWAKGGPIRHNGQIVEPRPSPDSLQETSVVLISTRVQGEALQHNQELLHPATLKGCPSIATRLTLVALGRADAAGTALNPLSPWDFAGAQGLLRAAGGELVGNNGRPLAWEGTSLVDPPHNIYFGARSQALAQCVVERMKPILT